MRDLKEILSFAKCDFMNIEAKNLRVIGIICGIFLVITFILIPFLGVVIIPIIGIYNILPLFGMDEKCNLYSLYGFLPAKMSNAVIGRFVANFANITFCTLVSVLALALSMKLDLYIKLNLFNLWDGNIPTATIETPVLVLIIMLLLVFCSTISVTNLTINYAVGTAKETIVSFGVVMVITLVVGGCIKIFEPDPAALVNKIFDMVEESPAMLSLILFGIAVAINAVGAALSCLLFRLRIRK